MTNYKQLNEEQRNTIQILINKQYSFTAIGKAIDKDRTTISKEIKRNRYIKSNFFEPFDFKGITKAINDCPTLKSPPYVCNTCPLKNKCNKHKLYYDATIAHRHYKDLLIQSRTGVDINPEEIEEIENIIVPLIKDKKQSVNQVYASHADILYFSKSTFYRYVSLRVFSLINLDLPKQVKYKQRNKSENENKRELALLNGRRYEDFVVFIYNHPKMHVFEMDTVIGKQEDEKVLLTLYFRDTHFMLIRLLDNKNIKSVNYEIDVLKEKLGIKLYAKIFRIGLTDNGSEFFDPYHIEFDYSTKRKIANLFYCNPSSPNQKGGIEKNHEYIRLFLPKGTSFKNLTIKDVQYIENTINNIPRNSLNNKSPYQLTLEKYPSFIHKLGYIKFIASDDIDLSIMKRDDK